MNKLNKDISKYPLPRTMSEFIYDSLKESIISNELKAKQRINEVELAERFHVSRTPVREAVLRLATGGFVKIDSYRRAVVKEVSFEELREILQVLGALDRLAVSLAVDNLTPKGIKKLETITERMGKNCHPNSVEKYMQLNLSFHNELWNSVSNKFLQEMLHFVRDKKERYSYARLYAFKKPGFLERSMRHHRELMETIKSGDKEKLQKIIAKHSTLLLDSSKGKEKEVLKEYLMAEENSVKA